MNEEMNTKVDELVGILRGTVSDEPVIALAGLHGGVRTGHGPDLDLFLFTAAPRSFSSRQRVILNACDEGTLPCITEDCSYPWGGSMDFVYHGTPVEVVVRLLPELERRVADALAGKIEIIPQTWTTNGYYSYIYLSELRSLKAVYDPRGLLADYQRRVEVYPPKLRTAIVSTFLGRAGVWMRNIHYASAIEDEDILFCGPVAQHIVLDLAQVVFAVNETYFDGDRHLQASLAQLPWCPDALKNDLEFLLTCKKDRVVLRRQADELRALYAEICRRVGRAQG